MTIIVTIVSLLFIFMYVIWGWTKDDVLYVVQRFEVPTVEEQCLAYMDNHGEIRSVRNKFVLRSNGSINVRLCAQLPFVLKRAAFVAQEYENSNPNTTYGATLILVILWEIVSDMRFVFFVLWKSNFNKNANNDRPELIDQMLNRGWRAIYIARNYCSVIVCNMIV